MTNCSHDEVQSVWIDTNIIIYYLRHNEEFSPKVKKLFEDAEAGKYELKISSVVINECVYVLMGKQFGIKKDTVKLMLKSVIRMPGVYMEEQAVIEEALDNYARKGIDFTDAYIAAHARAVKPAHVITQNIRDFRGLKVLAEVPKVIKDDGETE